MADPHLEQERILPRLRRILDVVSSWADPTPGAPVSAVPAIDDVSAAQAAVKSAAAAITVAAAGDASGPLAGTSPARLAGADSDGDADTDRTHGSAAGTARRHARATEPIWHLVAGQEARLLPGLHPGLPTAMPGAPGSHPADPGDPARAPGGAPAASHAPGPHATAQTGEPMTTAVGVGHVSGIRATHPAAGSGVAVVAVDAASGPIGAPAFAAPAAAVPAQDAVVLQPLLGQETPPLFGHATPPGRTSTGSDASGPVARTPGATGAPGAASSASGPVQAPWRATAPAAEPTPVAGHTSPRAGAAPGSLLHPPDLLGDGEPGPAGPEPRAVPADLQPQGPGTSLAPASAGTASAAGHASDHTFGRAFGRSELEDELADVLEHAAREAGVDLS
jgi:hypothetical protein